MKIEDVPTYSMAGVTLAGWANQDLTKQGVYEKSFSGLVKILDVWPAEINVNGCVLLLDLDSSEGCQVQEIDGQPMQYFNVEYS
jgi:hypothetical protein